MDFESVVLCMTSSSCFAFDEVKGQIIHVGVRMKKVAVGNGFVRIAWITESTITVQVKYNICT